MTEERVDVLAITMWVTPNFNHLELEKYLRKLEGVVNVRVTRLKTAI